MKRKHLFLTIILVLAAALVAFFYLKDRKEAPKGNLTILYDGKETTVDPFTLPLTDVKGTTINGKGKEKEISEKGVSLSEVLSLAGISGDAYQTARVVSSDEYSADLSAEEINSGTIAFLIREAADKGAGGGSGDKSGGGGSSGDKSGDGSTGGGSSDSNSAGGSDSASGGSGSGDKSGGGSGDTGSATIRLIVFGDSNSKRQVKDVVRIEVTK